MNNVSKLIVLMFILYACSSGKSNKQQPDDPFSILRSASEPVELTITEPENLYDSSVVPENKAFTCILLNSKKIYCYKGTGMKSGIFLSLTDTSSFRAYLKGVMKEIGDSLMVILKPSPEATYKATVDLLDEMVISEVKNYLLVKVSDEEASLLHIKNTDYSPPQPVAVQTPKSVISQKLPDNNAMLIEIREDGSVWYTIFLTGKNKEPQKVSNPVKEKLTAVIADYVINYGSDKPQYLVKADPKTTYPEFEKVTEALKQNNIYKYNLVTSLE